MADLQKGLEDLQEKLRKAENEIEQELDDAEEAFVDEITVEIENFRERYLTEIENFTDVDEIDPEYIENQVQRRFTEIFRKAYFSYAKRVEGVIRQNNGRMTAELRQLLEKTGILKQDDQKKLELTTYDIGLDKFEQEMTQLDREIRDLEEKIDVVGDDRAKAEELREKIRSLEGKRDKTEEAKRFYQTNAEQMMPSVNRQNVQRPEYVPRGGALGKLTTILVGEKVVMRTDQVVDSTARDDYKRSMQKALDGYDSQIQKLEREIASCDPGKSPSEYARLEKKLERLLKEKQDARLKKQAEFVEKIKKENAKLLKKQKGQISAYLENATYDWKAKIRETLGGNNEILQMVCSLIAAPLNAQIVQKQGELNLLVEQSKLAENEKAESLRQVQAKIETLLSIFERTRKLYDDLNALKEDVIEETAL